PIYATLKAAEEKLLAAHPALRTHYKTKQLFTRLETFLKSGRPADALTVVEWLAERQLSGSQREQLVLHRAFAYYLLRENQRARAYYRQFLRDYPTSTFVPAVLDRIGRLYLREGKFEAFLTVYDRLIREHPGSYYAASAMRLKGKEFELQGNFQEALEEFDRFMASYGNNPLVADVLWHRGWCQYQLGQYQAALKTFDRLVRAYPKSSTKDETLYWAARAAEQLQQAAQAADYYARVLQTGQYTYFGALSQDALARLSEAYPELALPQNMPEKKPLSLEPEITFATRQGRRHQQKALAFQQLGLDSLAAEEFAAALDQEKADQTMYLALARFYSQAGMYHDLVRLMQRRFWAWIVRGDEALPRIFWESVYPLSFPQIVARYSSANGLDPLFVQALMRAESVFDPQAFSPAGARGLMQLMPATGNRLARQLGLRIPSPEVYFRPEVNVLLGTTYLQELRQLFDDQLPPVIASYNAGEERVRTWWKAMYADDVPAFIAMIPYQETKRYVQKVLWYYREYQRIYRGR
ncbi:transglycosylase SLT domain-containing protein, partial [candidate division KSB3 bacterium]|nr:transglycosylase SLT domain-containing protein [candidate division KSB3 bacterium]MBD3327057.1 transglycosylase SLT domain-containing protein [candidate division KSB3 bacterium]